MGAGTKNSMGDTDIGRELKEKIKDLEKLLEAYYTGTIAEKIYCSVSRKHGQKKKLIFPVESHRKMSCFFL